MVASPNGPPSIPDGRSWRQELAAWLRLHRDDLFSDGSPAARELLGLDDATLDQLSRTERLTATFPHASPNIFFPRAITPWFARHRQSEDETTFHLRIVLTHTNLGDLSWRPYAWWFLNSHGELYRHTLFSRNRRQRHLVLAGLPSLTELPDHDFPAERSAAELATTAVNLAVSYLVLMATTERAAGFTVPRRTAYVPLDLMVEFFLRTGPSVAREWGAAVAAAAEAPGRCIGADGRLRVATGQRDAWILDNTSNLTLLSPLVDHVIGGTKMAGYWPTVVQQATFCGGEAPGLAVPRVTAQALPTPRPPLSVQLRDAGVPYSLGMCVHEHGAIVHDFHPFERKSVQH